MQRLNIAVLVSGGGSNLQAIIDAIQGKGLPVEIACVISDRREAFALQRAEKFGIESHYIGKGNYPKLEDRQEALKRQLLAQPLDLIVLAGYLSILSEEVVKLFKGKIINIHPSLLPRHCGPGYYGIKVHQSVILSGDKFSGATTHFVDEGVDTGEMIYQMTVPVEPFDTAEILAQKVLKIEHELLVKTLYDIAIGRVKWEEPNHG